MPFHPSNRSTRGNDVEWEWKINFKQLGKRLVKLKLIWNGNKKRNILFAKWIEISWWRISGKNLTIHIGNISIMSNNPFRVTFNPFYNLRKSPFKNKFMQKFNRYVNLYDFRYFDCWTSFVKVYYCRIKRTDRIKNFQKFNQRLEFHS